MCGSPNRNRRSPNRVLPVFCLAVAMLASGERLCAAGSQDPLLEELLPEDEREIYRVGFAEFQSLSLELEHIYVLRSLPLLLIDRTETVVEHTMLPDEIFSYRRRLLEEQRSAFGKELDQALDQRDQLIYEERGTSAFVQKRDSAEESVEKARAKLRVFESAEPGMIPIERVKPLEFWSSETENERVIDSDHPLHSIARTEDIDLIISGTVEQEEEFLFVTIFTYNALTEKRRTVTSVAAPLDEIEIAVEGNLRDVVRDLLGRPWASIHVEGAPPDAEIYLDDYLYGYGNATIEYAEPGKHTIRVALPQYDLVNSYTVEVSPYEDQMVMVSLPEIEVETIRLNTSPVGASVYQDSIWQGITPLDIDRPQAAQPLLIQRIDHYDSRLILLPDAPDTIHRELRPAVVDIGERLITGRDRFYGALGIFAVSGIVSLMLFGIYENIFQFTNTDAINQISAEEFARISNNANTLLAAQRISLFVSVTLFMNSIIELTKYVRAGSRYHDQ